MKGAMLLSSLLAEVLIDSLRFTALIALACCLAFELMRHARPAARHVVGMLALLAMAIAPIVLALWRVAAGRHVGEILAFNAATNMVEHVQT
jgi:hypothetical protein